jgi:hypothetical protein
MIIRQCLHPRLRGLMGKRPKAIGEMESYPYHRVPEKAREISSEVPSPILVSCRQPWKHRASPYSQPSLSTSRRTWSRWPRTRRPRC